MKPTLVVTGSSGFVASDVLPRLTDDFTIIGIDRNPGTFTSVEADISKLVSATDLLLMEGFYVLHLAAARFDYGASAIDYYTDNVWELLICDDDSTDNTKEIIESLALVDERVNVVTNTEGAGAASARNSCLKVASGRYVAFLDSDDQWVEYKLELQVEALKKGAHFCLADYYVMSEAGDIEGLVNAPVTLNFRLMLLSNFIGCLTVMYDTQYFGKVVQPPLKKRNDYALWLKMLRSKPSANIVAVTQPLAYYRANSYGLSSIKIDA